MGVFILLDTLMKSHGFETYCNQCLLPYDMLMIANTNQQYPGYSFRVRVKKTSAYVSLKQGE